VFLISTRATLMCLCLDHYATNAREDGVLLTSSEGKTRPKLTSLQTTLQTTQGEHPPLQRSKPGSYVRR
jgi:hypothetical protein